LKLNFHQLRCFHAVAEHGSFTAAARALFVGQPSITTHVRALESRFGVELFGRHGHNVALTDAGHRLYAISQRIFSLEAEAVETLRAAGGLLVGTLRIGAIGAAEVARIVVAFGQRYPDVELSVSLGNTKSVVDDLLAFRADVAIAPRLGEDRRFRTAPYSRSRIVLLVGREHTWAKRRTVRVAELHGQRMVLRELGSATRRMLEETLAAAGVRVRPVLEIESREAVRESVAAGIGVGIAVEEESHPDSRVRALRIADAPMFLELEIAALAERREAPLIKAFFDVVAAMRPPGKA
jgi:aminoethylphosphonate catabolism LysR family transcriptional regulator